MKKIVLAAACMLFICIVFPQTATDTDANGTPEKQSFASIDATYYSNFLADTGEVIHTIPAPGYKCNGITFDGTDLWVSDNDCRLIHKISTVDGTVLKTFPYTNQYNFIEGLAWDGEYLLACGWKDSGGGESTVLVLDTSDGTAMNFIYYPVTTAWPHGITYDIGNENIWANCFNTKTLDLIDRSTGSLIKSIPAPGGKSVGLTWDGTYLWSDDFATHLVYKIDPANGMILASFPAPVYNPRDLAFDGQYLWITCWEDQTIYQVDAMPANIDEPDMGSLLIYPNPVHDLARMEYMINKTGVVTINLYNVEGRHVLTVLESMQNPGKHEFVFQANGIPDGCYIITLDLDGKKLFSKRIIIL